MGRAALSKRLTGSPEMVSVLATPVTMTLEGTGKVMDMLYLAWAIDALLQAPLVSSACK
jgi:hypothetical protein